MRLRRLALAFAAPAAVVAACNGGPDSGGIQILTVDDPFVGPPAATEITVNALGLDGGTTLLAEVPATAGSVDLGTYEESNTESISVTATDGAGTTVASGETLSVELGALAGATLGVFVQRSGTLSRMPTPLSDARPSPLVEILGGRYVLVAGGTDATLQTQTQLYDLIAWSPLASPPTLPFAPQSMAVAELQALAISSTQATWYDLTESTSTAATAPSGGPSWGDVAGGATVTASDFSVSYVVGGTRASGAATSAVLIVAASGTLSWGTLTVARLGASAAWVDGLGLVVVGGNVTSSTPSSLAPGVEVLSPGATTSLALGYPADATAGAGVTALDSSHVLVVGGSGANGTAARVFTLPCSVSASCAPVLWSTALPTPLPLAQAFGIDPQTAFVTGEDPSGAMHAYRLSSSVVAEVPFRVPRSHAQAVRLPFGLPGAGPVAVVGGATSLESFIP